MTMLSVKTEAPPPGRARVSGLPYVPWVVAGCTYTLLVGVGVVSYWRGVWQLCDEYFFPDDGKASAWLSMGLSVVMFVPLMAYFHFIHTVPEGCAPVTVFMGKVKPDGNAATEPPPMARRPWFLVVLSWVGMVAQRVHRIILMALFGFGCVNFWRGVWYLWNEYAITDSLNNEESSWLSACVGLALVCAVGSTSSIVAPPYVLLTDFDEFPALLLPLNALPPLLRFTPREKSKEEANEGGETIEKYAL